MKKFLPLCIFSLIFFNCIEAESQVPGEWVWLHGDSTTYSTGHFGIQGVPDPLNVPPSSYESCSWKDLNGNFWLYGGWSPSGTYADLWKYDPTTNEWTWVKGQGTVNYAGSYGIQGVSSPTNNPPSMSEGSTTWTDNQGDLWLFGSRKNDLWRYVISSNEWTWIKGPNISGNLGVYGTQGVPSLLNNPPSRYECASSWTDASGNLWLFGGMYSGGYNDLWKYDISTNEWTWMKGSSTTNQLGVYGTNGVEDPANTPGARASYTHWMDGAGYFYIFGGEKITFPYIQFNDFWRYNPSTNAWTWMGGNNASNSDGHYDSKCIEDSACIPSSRFENRVVWTDQRGNFWHFGGGTGTGAGQVKNDLWMYCVAENMWIWQSGDSIFNPTGHWGTIGVSDPLNKPNGRVGAVSWSDSNNHLYFFGGSSSGFGVYRNDLWMYTIDTLCTSCITTPVANFYAEDLCAGTCTDFTNLSSGATSFVWSFAGGNPSVSIDVSPAQICYPTPGYYDVTLIASNGITSDTLIMTNYINVYPTPQPQAITQIGDTLFANQGSSYYQWYYNGNIIAGATNYFYIATTNGNYSVVATDENGCEVEAVINNVIANNSQLAVGNWQLAVYPNPAGEKLFVNSYLPAQKRGAAEGLFGTAVELYIYNVLGEKVYTANHTSTANNEPIIINCEDFPTGTYSLEIISKEKTYRTKFLKQ